MERTPSQISADFRAMPGDSGQGGGRLLPSSAVKEGDKGPLVDEAPAAAADYASTSAGDPSQSGGTYEEADAAARVAAATRHVLGEEADIAQLKARLAAPVAGAGAAARAS